MRDEVRTGHEARQHERHGTGEKADQQQKATGTIRTRLRFRSTKPETGGFRCEATGNDSHFMRAVFHEQESGNDAQYG